MSLETEIEKTIKGVGFKFGRFSSNSFDRRLDSGSPQAPPGMTVLVGRRYNQDPIEESINELAFDKMIRRLRSTFGQFPDKRTGLNFVYGIEDIALGAFSLFFTQSPSFLAFQTAMRKNKGRDNADSLFGVKRSRATIISGTFWTRCLRRRSFPFSTMFGL